MLDGVELPRSVEPSRSVAGAYYANCREAIQAGVAPLYRGSTGYRRPLDRDGDGIACEPYRGP